MAVACMTAKPFSSTYDDTTGHEQKFIMALSAQSRALVKPLAERLND